MGYAAGVVALIAVYVVLATSFDLMVTDAGLLVFGHPAFFAIGAYLEALLSFTHGPWVGMPIAVVGSGLAAITLVVATTRMQGIGLIVATMALMLGIQQVAGNLNVVGASSGLSNMPMFFSQSVPAATLLVVIAALVVVAMTVLRRRTFGLLLRALRDSESAFTMVGRNALVLKTTVLCVGCATAGLAGAMYAGYFQYIDPTLFGQTTMTAILAMVVLGGKGVSYGPVLGAILLELLPQALTFLNVSPTLVGPGEQLAYAAFVALFVLFVPKGIAGWLPARGGHKRPSDLSASVGSEA